MTALFGAGLAAGRAEARSTGAPTGAKQSVSMQHFDRGVQAFDQGRIPDAIAAFQASMAIEPSPNTRFRLGRCYKVLGKVGSAYTQFYRAAREAEDRSNATGELRYRATQEAANAELEELRPIVPMLELKLPEPIPEGARVLLDGEAIPRDAWGQPLPVDPGKHRLVATAPRTQEFSASFELALSQKQSLTVSLLRLPTAELRLAIPTKPAGLVVLLDEQSLPPEQFEAPRQVDAGSHTIDARAPGFVPFRWRSKLADQETQTVTIALKADLGSARWVALSLGVLGAGTLAAAIGYGVVAQRASDEQEQLDPLYRDPATRDTIQTQAKVATGLYVAGGALGAAAIVVGAVAASKRATAPIAAKGASALRVIPALGPTSTGLVLMGRF